MKLNTSKKAPKRSIGTLENKKVTKPTHGGARVDAGRHPKSYSTKKVTIKLPILLDKGMGRLEGINKTAYISYLLATGLSKLLQDNAEYKEMAKVMKEYIFKRNNKS